jgi:hypothetical protein
MPDTTAGSGGDRRILMRGAIPTHRSELAAATPHVPRIGAPPNIIRIPAQLDPDAWGNHQYGDCVTAEEAFNKGCATPSVYIPYDEVIAWATKHGTLNGAYLTQVMHMMHTDGFAQDGHTYDDGPYFSVAWTNPSTLQSAISLAPVKIGVAAQQLEAAYYTTNGNSGWFGHGFQPDATEDHCVSLSGYGSLAWLADQLHVQVPAGLDPNAPGYALFTWGSIGIIDHPSMVAITHEAWLRNPSTVIKPGHAAPAAA